MTTVMDNSELLLPFAKKVWPTVAESDIQKYVDLLPRAISSLPEKEKNVVKARNGLWMEKKNIATLAAELGVSGGRVSQIEKEGLTSIVSQVEFLVTSGKTDGPFIFDLALTPRTKNALIKLGLVTVEDVCAKTSKFFLVQDNFGAESLKNLIEELGKLNKSLTTI